MSKEDFIKAGYVNEGYISPELSSNSVYPDYIEKNVTEAIEKIKRVKTENNISFAFMTDLHYSVTENHDIRIQRLMNAYRQIKDELGIDMVILGGDFVNDGVKDYKLNNYRALRECFEGVRYFPANGNHDDNSVWDLCIESEKSISHLSTGELYDELFSHLPSLGVKSDTKEKVLYYYLDENNVRYIFVDGNDIPERYDENGKLIHTKQHLFALSQKQIDWLLNDALNVESGTDIVIVAHALPLMNKEAHKVSAKELWMLDVLGDIIDAYQTGKAISQSYFEGEFKVNVDVDFSKGQRGNIIACFGGHYHADFEEYSESGVPYIYTGNVIMYKYSVPRIDGDKSELLFDVATIDKEKRTIYTTRIGAGNDREIKY